MGAANGSRGNGRVWAWVLASAGVVAAVGLMPVAWVRADHEQPSAQLVKLEFKFEGAAGCAAAKCHGAPKANPAPKPAGDEYITWSQGKADQNPRTPDKHSVAHKTLSKPESDEIVKKMGLTGKATAAEACTACHALVVPANLQMSNYNVKEGVTCGACHGPYEKWEKPHNQPGGADGLRKQCGYTVLEADKMPYSTESKEHKDLLTKFGLYDTRPIMARAEKCTSCHLSIDAKMVEAGHPQPTFELAYYTELEPPHWREPGGFWGTKVWAAGQVVCLREAMQQLADRAKAGASPKLVQDAYEQAMGHLLVLKPIAGGAAAAGLAKVEADLKAAAKDNAKLAAAGAVGAEIASKMMPAIAGMTADEKATGALIGAIAQASGVATDAGMAGAKQQALGLASLVAAYKKGKGASPALDALEAAVGDKLLAQFDDPTKFSAAGFGAGLKDVAGKVGAAVPGGGGGGAGPIDIK